MSKNHTLNIYTIKRAFGINAHFTSNIIQFSYKDLIFSILGDCELSEEGLFEVLKFATEDQHGGNYEIPRGPRTLEIIYDILAAGQLPFFYQGYMKSGDVMCLESTLNQDTFFFPKGFEDLRSIRFKGIIFREG